FYNELTTSATYTLSLHDALPICKKVHIRLRGHFDKRDDTPQDTELRRRTVTGKLYPYRLTQHPNERPQVYSDSDPTGRIGWDDRSEEHTSELQSRFDLVCRLLLE